jgi:hypothetical protein
LTQAVIAMTGTGRVTRREQCGSREWLVLIQDCRGCARCGAVWAVQHRREFVPARPGREEHLVT